MKYNIFNQGKVAASLALAGIIAFSAVGTALAGPPAQGAAARQGIFGNVTAKGDNSFTVETRGDAVVELLVDQETSFRVPGTDTAIFDDLMLGSRVAVLAVEDGGSLTALKVMPVPAEPRRQHRVLTVTEVTGNTVIAEDAQGNRVEVELDHELSDDVTGNLITFIGERSSNSNRFKANAEVKIGQVVKRLEAQARRLQQETAAESGAGASGKKARNLARVEERLEANMQRHLDRFTALLDKAPPQARPHLESAMERTLSGYRSSLEGLEKGRGKQAAKRIGFRNLQGWVESVDTDNGTITVRGRADNQVTLEVTAETEIRFGEASASLGDIPEGVRVTIRHQRGGPTATQIRVKTEASAEGTVQSVDEATGAVIIELPDGATLDLTVTDKTKIEVNDSDGGIGDLQAGILVKVKYDTTNQTALEIESTNRGKVQGEITSVDEATGAITIVSRDGAELVLTITDETRVRIRGFILGLPGLSAGMEVRGAYDLATGEAIQLQIKGEDARDSRDRDGRGDRGDREELRAAGTIGSVDAEGGTITVQVDGDGELTLHVGDETDIEVNGEDASLSDLSDGDRVRVEYDRDAMTAREIKTRSRAAGPSGERPSDRGRGFP